MANAPSTVTELHDEPAYLTGSQNASVALREWNIRFPESTVSPYFVPRTISGPLAQHILQSLYLTSASSPAVSQKTVPGWMMPWYALSGIVQIVLLVTWRCIRAGGSDLVGQAKKTGEYQGEQQLHIGAGVCCIIIVLKCMAGISQDIFVPSTPQMVLDLNTNAATLGLTLQLNWIFMSIGALVLGSLSDKYGRRPVMLWALALFTVTTIGVGTCQNVSAAIAFRCIEGFAEGIWVLCDAIVRDAFPQPDERGKWNGILDTIASLSPMVAPVIGGGIATLLGWRATFLFLTFIGISVFTSALFLLPETNPAMCNDTEALETTAGDESEETWTIVRRGFGQSWFLWATCGLFAFIQGSGAGLGTNLHYALQNGRGYSVLSSSLYLLMLPIIGILGMTLTVALISAKAKCWPMMQKGFMGIVIAGVSSILIGTLENKGGQLPLVVTFIPMVIFMLVWPMAGVPARILYMQSFGKAAGAAMAVASTMCLTTQAACAFVMTVATDASGEPALWVSYGIVLMLCILAWVLPLGFGEPLEVQAWDQSAADQTAGKAEAEAHPANQDDKDGKATMD